jgi:hypothetical protein
MRGDCCCAAEAADRIIALQSALWDEEEARIVLDSAESFLRFFVKYPNLKRADLSITPRGNLRARWRADPSRHFAIEFLGEDAGSFVLFAPSPTAPGGVARLSGVDGVRSIMEKSKAYGVMEWVEERADSARS